MLDPRRAGSPRSAPARWTACAFSSGRSRRRCSCERTAEGPPRPAASRSRAPGGPGCSPPRTNPRRAAVRGGSFPRSRTSRSSMRASFSSGPAVRGPGDARVCRPRAERSSALIGRSVAPGRGRWRPAAGGLAGPRSGPWVIRTAPQVRRLAMTWPSTSSRYGVNAGYVRELFEDWKSDPQRVEESQRRIFERAGDTPRGAQRGRRCERPSSPISTPRATPARGAGRRRGQIAVNMEASLELPVASVRTLSARSSARTGRSSTSTCSCAPSARRASPTSWPTPGADARRAAAVAVLVRRARREALPPRACAPTSASPSTSRGPRATCSSCRASRPPRPWTSASSTGPSRTSSSAAAWAASTADFAETTCTLTNPGGFGTVMSVPRLMPGEGLIVATGSIGVPPGSATCRAPPSPSAIGPVMAMTSTYDHRVIQGASRACS